MAENLLRKNELWFVRLSIPADLRDFFGKTEFKVSLRTDSKAEAQLQKLPYIHEFKRKIKEAREKLYKKNNKDFENITSKKYEDLLEHLYKSSKTLREMRDERIKDHFFDCETIDYKKLTDHSIWLLDKTNLFLKEELVDKFRDDIDKNFTNKFYKQIRNSEVNVHEYYNDLYMFSVKMLHECIVNEIDSNKKKSLVIDIEEKKEEFYKAVYDEEYKIKVRSDFNQKRIEKYKEYAINIKEKTMKTIDREISAIHKFNHFIENNNVEIITFRNVDKYINDNFKDKSPRTKKIHVSALNSIFKYLMKHDDDFINKYEKLNNPFLNHEFGGKNKAESYIGFEKEDIVKILEATKKKGDEDLYDLIKIASYTGCRREEILRLKVDDIVIKNGIKCFDIKKAKTKAGVRLVPVHTKLFDIIEKRSLNKSKEDFLFSVASKGKYNVRSELFTKRFTRLKNSLGYEKRYAFHSIRSTVITMLQEKKVEGLTIMSTVGHLTNTITFDIYSEGATVENKFEAIQKLSYE